MLYSGSVLILPRQLWKLPFPFLGFQHVQPEPQRSQMLHSSAEELDAQSTWPARPEDNLKYSTEPGWHCNARQRTSVSRPLPLLTLVSSLGHDQHVHFCMGIKNEVPRILKNEVQTKCYACHDLTKRNERNELENRTRYQFSCCHYKNKQKNYFTSEETKHTKTKQKQS